MKNSLFILVTIIGLHQVSSAQNHQSDRECNCEIIETNVAIKEINKIHQTVEDVHPNAYFKFEKEYVVAYRDSLISKWEVDEVICFREYLTDAMKMTALMSNGHTGVDWQSKLLINELKKNKLLPIILETKDDEHRIVSTVRHLRDLEGASLKVINGLPISELYEEFLSYLGGELEMKKTYVDLMFSIFLFLDNRLKAPFSLEFEKKNEVKLRGVSVFKANRMINNYASIQSSYTFNLIDGNIGYLEYNSCQNPVKFRAFLEETFQKIDEEKIDKLIIDIRKNTGGNSELNDDLLCYITKQPYRQMSGRYWKVSEQVKRQIEKNGLWKDFVDSAFIHQYLGRLPGDKLFTNEEEMVIPRAVDYFYDGKVCLLVGPQTFSSANMLADACKTFNIMPIFGQPTGEMVNDFGELVSFKLSDSGVYLNIATTYDIGAENNPNNHQVIIPNIITDHAFKDAILWLNEK